jgi:hypothetical protein
MADLDSRLKLMSKTVAAKKAATAVKSTKDESLVVDAALYDWIELLDEGGAGSKTRIDNEASRIQRNLSRLDKMADKEISSDVLRLLTMREFGASAKFSFEYMYQALTNARKIKATIYMALCLVESPGCVYPDASLSTIHEDLNQCNPHALRWLAATCASFPESMLNRYISIVKNILLRPSADSRLLEKGLAALLNVMRSHHSHVQIGEIIPM